jgi:PilZ domain
VGIREVRLNPVREFVKDVFQLPFIFSAPKWGGLVESRKAFRYALSASAVFTWQDEVGVRQQGGGITRDISTTGAFIYSAVPPLANVPIRVEFDLPPFREGAGSLRIAFRGHVVRIEESEADPDHTGFAVIGESTILGSGKGR